MNDRFLFNAVVSSYYDIDTPENYEEFEPQIYLENVDLFSDEIGIDYDRLLDAVQKQLNLDKSEISQVMQHFEDNSNSSSEEYITIKPDKVLQCTGLKDKNGKLIYEGDIINDKSNHIRVVVWEQDSFKYPALKTSRYFHSPISNKLEERKVDLRGKLTFQDNVYKCDKKHFEVIGNIYENKSLLECEG